MQEGPRVLLFVLLIASGSTTVQGQPLTCYPIRPGDTAARLAVRLTGSADNRYQAWFQIVNTATNGFVPKSRYDVIHSGWHVCVATAVILRGAAPAYDHASASLLTPQIPFTPRTTLTVLWWVVPLAVVVAGLMTKPASKYLARRRLLLDIMSGFAARFVTEFERPLFRRDGAPPVRTWVRFTPGRQRLEIRLAPAEGRTYPNLSDHKRNVEYDVGRIFGLLDDEPFINGPLYAEGPWVVIPCRLAIDRPSEGAP